MANVAIKIKIAVIGIISIISIFTGKYIYKCKYVHDYCLIELNQKTRIFDPQLAINVPYWSSITDYEKLENIKKKYDLFLNDVDFKKNMLIISYGAELKSMDYNSQESTFKTRGHYIGFPQFGHLMPNNIYIYETKLIPLIDVEIAGFSPDYKGKYR